MRAGAARAWRCARRGVSMSSASTCRPTSSRWLGVGGRALGVAEHPREFETARSPRPRVRRRVRRGALPVPGRVRSARRRRRRRSRCSARFAARAASRRPARSERVQRLLRAAAPRSGDTFDAARRSITSGRRCAIAGGTERDVRPLDHLLHAARADAARACGRSRRRCRARCDARRYAARAARRSICPSTCCSRTGIERRAPIEACVFRDGRRVCTLVTLLRRSGPLARPPRHPSDRATCPPADGTHDKE